jgi:hypothetical protein
MPRFVIEREIAGAGKWTPEQRRAAAVTRISEVRGQLDPTSAER